MKPLVEALGGEKWITISTVRPLLYKLKNTYLAPTSSDNRMAKNLRKSMLSNLNQRYCEAQLKILNMATFLDPRFKSLSFLPEEGRKEITTDIELELSEMLAEFTSSSDSTTQEPPRKKQKEEFKLLELIDDIVNPSQENQTAATSKERAKSEVSKYIGEA